MSAPAELPSDLMRVKAAEVIHDQVYSKCPKPDQSMSHGRHGKKALPRPSRSWHFIIVIVIIIIIIILVVL